MPLIDDTVVTLDSQLLGTTPKNQADMLVQVVAYWISSGFARCNYSCNGSVAGVPGDGINRWITWNDLKGTGGGSGFSFMVLDFVGMGSYQLMLYINLSGGWMEVQWTMAPNGGFTGGTPLVSPTAPNGYATVLPIDQWLGTGPVGDPQFHASVWTADDFSYTRVAWWFAGHIVAFWQFETLRNPPGPWTTPFMHVAMGTGNDYTSPSIRLNAVTYGLNRGSGGFEKGVFLPAGVTHELYGSMEQVQQGGTNYVPKFTTTTQFGVGQHIWTSPPGIQSIGAPAGSNGPVGYQANLWPVTPIFNDGDTIGDARQFIVIGEFFATWDGSDSAHLGGAPVTIPTALMYGRSTA